MKNTFIIMLHTTALPMLKDETLLNRKYECTFKFHAVKNNYITK